MSQHIYNILNYWKQINETSSNLQAQIPQMVHFIKRILIDEYQSFYIIDALNKKFVYVHENALFLCGLTSRAFMNMGYDFYTQYVHPEDIPILLEVNKIGLSGYQKLSKEDQEKDIYISYDFRIKNGKIYLPIHHTLIPLAKNNKQQITLALCKVSLTDQKNSSLITARLENKTVLWNKEKEDWEEYLQIQLSNKDKEIICLSSQGYTEKELAHQLQLSESSIKKRKKILFQKLNVTNMSEAIVACCTRKLL